MEEGKVSFNRQTDRQTCYDVLRTILVILVVIGHATYYDIITPFGGIQYGMLMKESGIQDTAFHVLMSEITNFIYTFHMPAFIALSGSLFALGKRMSFKDVIVKKQRGY